VACALNFLTETNYHIKGMANPWNYFIVRGGLRICGAPEHWKMWWGVVEC
jgi:hypothetical protein